MAKGDIKGNLWRRGNQWYFRHTVPKPLRSYFPSKTGKPRDLIVEPLGDSHEFAKIRAAQHLAVTLDVFAQIRAGVIKTPEQAMAALRGPDEAQQVDERLKRFQLLQRASWFEHYGAAFGSEQNQVAAAPIGETVSEAAEAWLASMESQPLTIDGHRKRVQAFVKHSGDMLLTDVDRAKAWDFLSSLNVSQGTRNAYQTTLKCVFDHAKDPRGRFTGENPFAFKKKKAKGDSYAPFTIDELRTLFAKLPREIAPARHSPETALPWVAAIALYSGARLEEIAQLKAADIRECSANGATVTVIDVHNGGTNKLKNETSARLIPVHSELVRLGLLRYRDAVKSGPLFPGLKRRESKGGKVGARLGELFRKKLVALGLKRDGLCFHSFRHTAAGRLDAAEVRQSDAARVLGHAVEGMSFGTYSQEGPGLKQVAATVEKITYEGLRL
jgi:integrase